MAKKVLVLDDDLAVLEAVETALTYEDFEVVTIGRTYNIFKTIEEHNPDIILLDFILEGLTGGEICRNIKSNPATRHLPVIIISAYQGNIGPLKSFGCDHFIAKPFDLIELIDGINQTLDKKSINY
jgi:CheY-like chemotaxis protein